MTRNGNDSFKQEYLYIEEVPLDYYKSAKDIDNKNKNDEVERGYTVISLFDHDED